MPDKNIVDDYYSQIDSWEKVSNKNNESKKTVVVTKKKIIIKKPIVIPKKEWVFSWWDKKNNEIKKTDQKVKVRKKWFVQKIEVVKRDDIAKKKVEEAYRKKVDAVYKKKTEEVHKKKIEEAYRKNEQEKVPKKNIIVKKIDRSIITKAPVVVIKDAKTLAKDYSKKFTNNKKPVKSWDNIYDTEAKKSKLFLWDKKTRWRLKFTDEKEITFIRSNKVNKKQEKNIGDIKQNLIEKRGEIIIVPEILSLKELSEKIGVVLPKLMAEFMKNWMMVNINSKIDFDSASIIAGVFDIKLERDISGWASVEDLFSWNITDLLKEDDQSKLVPRTPVVSIMWHVDHGKTSLLDYIRKAKVASGEAGWITQSIWAYQVELDNGKITFLDTPWHEAFTVMRARWAKSTDIAVLLVAADEWVKPQTIESINHAKEAGIPIIVAINKMDKVWANPEHVKWQLVEQWLTSEDWGGDTPMVPISANTGFWIDDLLEIILLVAEMQEMKANPDRAWIATVIESHLDHKLGPVATVLINTWTVKMWDNIVCQDTYWKIKVLKNYTNHWIKYGIPWEPVLIVWLDKVVNGWDILQVVSSVEQAKQKAEEYRAILFKQKTAWFSWLALLMSKIKAWNLKQLKIILKADTNWSLEAIKWALTKLSTPETTVQIIHAWVGSITESDILMWQWSEAILVGFNVWVLPTAKSVLETSLVEYISSDIIYHITDKIERIVTWMLDPKEVEVILCKAKVWGIFFTWKWFMILGLKVPPESKIENKTLVRIIRKKKMIWNWKIESLKVWTLEVKELEGPIECWIKFITNVAVEMWDDLEIYKIEIQK